MALMLGATGKLMTLNGKLFDDVNGTDCCCVAVDCCEILINFDTLIVTGDIVGNPTGTPNDCWTGDVDPGTGAEFSSVADFSICCVNIGGKSYLRVSFSISSSAPCAQSFTQDVPLDPCCPVNEDVTFTGVDPLCQSSGTITFNIASDPTIQCP